MRAFYFFDNLRGVRYKYLTPRLALRYALFVNQTGIYNYHSSVTAKKQSWVSISE